MKLKEILVEFLDIEKTLEKYEDKIIERSKKDNLNLTAREILEKFINIDPTGKKGKYVLWLLKNYLKGNKELISNLNNLEELKEYLFLFHKFKNYIPEEYRDIHKVDSLKMIKELTKKFKGIKTSREQKKEEKKEIMAETRIVYSGHEGTILIPLTQRASCFWGRSTKWCTATKKENYFDYYNREGHLYILILPNGKRYQAHFEMDEFRDNEDKKLNENDQIFKDENFVKLILKLFEIVTGSNSLKEINNNIKKYGLEIYNIFCNILSEIATKKDIIEILDGDREFLIYPHQKLRKKVKELMKDDLSFKNKVYSYNDQYPKIFEKY